MKIAYIYSFFVALSGIGFQLFFNSQVDKATLGSNIPTILSTISVLVLAVIFSIYHTRRAELNGKMTFPEAMKTGLRTTSVSAVLLAIFNYLYHKYHYNDVILASNPELEEEVKKMIIENGPFSASTGSLLSVLFIGGVISSIVAVIAKTER